MSSHHNSNNNDTSMGDAFMQRRKQRGGQEQQRGGQEQDTGGRPPSLMDIQAEQQQQRSRPPPPQQQQQQQYNQRRSNDDRADFGGQRRSSNNDDRADFGGRRDQRRGDQRRGGQHDHSDLPIEQGCVCALKDAFGFIYCADREEEIFFHFSEVQNCHPADLKMDDEMEFRVGSDRNSDKLRAFQLHRLDRGTIVWEIEQDNGHRFQGVVEKSVRTDRSGNVQQEGVIRMLEKQQEEETEQVAASGAVVHFTPNDYKPNGADKQEENKSDRRDFRRGTSTASNSSRGGGGGGNRLGINDLVEFTLITSRRNKTQYARSIHLLQSDRERQLALREEKMLADASTEQGIVTSLKSDFGFIRSNKRREEVYFHYTNVDLGGDDNDDEEEQELKVGNEMQFLVVTEEGGNGRKGKVSARQVKFLPPGTVQFQTMLATGVTGVVTRCPHPADSGYSSDLTGVVRLTESIKDVDEEGNQRQVSEIAFHSADSPGKTYTLREGTLGLWIREGDTLLFNVAKETIDGSLRVYPTKKQVGDDTAEDESPSVKLVACALATRQEGTIHVIKEQFGFINLAERTAETYFRLYEQFPKELQLDLLRGMGIKDQTGLELATGTEVHFDLSVQREVIKSRNRNQRGGQQETLKGQRILLLPPGTISPQTKIIAAGIKGVVEKEDAKHVYAGTIDLVEEHDGMTLEERHPLVSKLVQSLLENKEAAPKSLIFPDVQSVKEDEIVMNVVDGLGKGLLRCSNLPVAGQGKNGGRLCITWVNEQVVNEPDAEGKDESDNQVEETNSSTKDIPHEQDQIKEDSDVKSERPSKKKISKKKGPHPKVVKLVRYDKPSLAKEFHDEQPPRVGDQVTCDVVQYRRTGAVLLRDVRIVERKDPDAAGGALVESSETGIGIVSEVVAARQFGFISILDEGAARREVLFFHFKDVGNVKGKGLIKKGDEARFSIATQKGGKRTAVNIELVPRGTLDISSKAAKNACEGFVLMEPSHSSLKDTPDRGNKSSPGSLSPVRGGLSPKRGGGGVGRWDNVDLVDGKKRNVMSKEEGGILLIKDPANMFGAQKKPAQPLSSKESADSDTMDDTIQENTDADGLPECALCTRLPYKQGAIAIHGAGATSVADSSAKGPRRGDLVSFVKAKNGKGVRDVRVVTKGAATLIRGRLEQIVIDRDAPGLSTALFIAATEKEEAYPVQLDEVVSCHMSVLNDKETVEGLLHEGKIFGVCRTKDLFLESKLGSSHKLRTKLNLAVRKDLGGKIMAQSMMGKGPDGTNGFIKGWTTRLSKYAAATKPLEEAKQSTDDQLTSDSAY